MIRARHPATYPLMTLIGALLLFALLALLASMAHAGPADALHDPLTSPPLDTIASLHAARAAGGWVLALAAGAVLVLRGMASLPGAAGAWLRTGRRATAIAGLSTVAVAVYDALSTGQGWGPVVMAVFAAVSLLWSPVHPASAPGVTVTRAPEAGRTRGSVMLALALAGVGGALLLGGCGAGMRERAAAGAAAGVSCTLGAVAEIAAKAEPDIARAVRAKVSATGQVDTNALAKLLDSLVTAGERCAGASVIAAIALPAQPQPGVATQALSTPQPAAAQLVLALGAARQRWGGPWTGPIETTAGRVP